MTTCQVWQHRLSIVCEHTVYQGLNDKGQLGYEDTTHRGRQETTSGDYLPIVNLGTDFDVVDLALCAKATCVKSSTGQVKCFGENINGQLGYGDQTQRGDTAGSMGDALPFVDIGSGFSETGYHFADTSRGTGYHHCVFEEADELLVKCWGTNVILLSNLRLH